MANYQKLRSRFPARRKYLIKLNFHHCLICFSMMFKNENAFILIGPFRQLITMNDLPDKGVINDELLKPILNAGILIQGEKIFEVGNYHELQRKATELNSEIVELNEDFVALPGFIDAHTHICFAGSRANDYALRN